VYTLDKCGLPSTVSIMNTATAPAATDFKPGDRVCCYDTFTGTVIRVVDNFLGGFALVDYDTDFAGVTAVYSPYIQAI
jgi:hypothetical protein